MRCSRFQESWRCSIGDLNRYKGIHEYVWWHVCLFFGPLCLLYLSVFCAFFQRLFLFCLPWVRLSLRTLATAGSLEDDLMGDQIKQSNNITSLFCNFQIVGVCVHYRQGRFFFLSSFNFAFIFYIHIIFFFLSEIVLWFSPLDELLFFSLSSARIVFIIDFWPPYGSLISTVSCPRNAGHALLKIFIDTKRTFSRCHILYTRDSSGHE